MKPYLPYNVLLLLACIAMGSVVLYNVFLREQSEMTLQYSYPEIVQEQPAQQPPEPERIIPEEWEPGPDEAKQSEPQGEEQPLTQVQFPLDINTATVEQLKFIPRVGDVMSQRIVQYREQIGGYADLEQLRDIKGVGDSTYEHLYAYLYIAEEPQEQQTE